MEIGKLKSYKCEFADGEIEIIDCLDDAEAILESFDYEEEHGACFVIVLLDDQYNEVETVF